jgi:hypothetical protein
VHKIAFGLESQFAQQKGVFSSAAGNQKQDMAMACKFCLHSAARPALLLKK